MSLHFPKDFIWGTSTAAYQIETAFEHDWKGVKSKDGYIFDRTTDHELRMKEDVELIANVAKSYRMSMQWSKLQREPLGLFHQETVDHYKRLLDSLKEKDMQIMLVLHHFTDPLWFVKLGKWQNERCLHSFYNYTEQFVKHFGAYADYWNTFNEPNVFVSNGWMEGDFPPFKKNYVEGFKIINQLGKAHEEAYDIIKAKSGKPIGISHNTVHFSAEHWAAFPQVNLNDWWFNEHCLSKFEKVDFLGMSYYAKIPYIPQGINYHTNPDLFKKLNKPHDGMWEYFPEGMGKFIRRYWKKYRKPIIITESGVCTDNDSFRIQAMQDYVSIVHQCIKEGIDIKGYYWWSTWDNFEWNLGPTYRFGLYRTDLKTMNRLHTPSVDAYKRITESNSLPDLSDLIPTEQGELTKLV